MTRSAIILAAALLGGCSPPSPEKVCEHVEAITDAGLAQCLSRLREMRRQDPKEYEKRARCELQAEDAQELSTCARLWPR